MTAPRLASGLRLRTDTRGQSIVEFAVAVPVLMLLLLAMLEFGNAFNHHLTLEYATREGARTGAALVNGGGALGCGASQSPNASTVDPLIIAAVERVLEAPGSAVRVSDIGRIRIYRATATGTVDSGLYNNWTYDPGGGPVVDGRALDFRQTSAGWPACYRDYGGHPTFPYSIGVDLTYTYRYITPLGSAMGLVGGPAPGTLAMTDRAVMALEPTK